MGWYLFYSFIFWICRSAAGSICLGWMLIWAHQYHIRNNHHSNNHHSNNHHSSNNHSSNNNLNVSIPAFLLFLWWIMLVLWLVYYYIRGNIRYTNNTAPRVTLWRQQSEFSPCKGWWNAAEWCLSLPLPTLLPRPCPESMICCEALLWSLPQYQYQPPPYTFHFCLITFTRSEQRFTVGGDWQTDRLFVTFSFNTVR